MSKISKRTIGLLAGVVIVALLAAVILLVQRTPAEGDGESSSSQSSSSVVLSPYAVEDVVSVEIKTVDEEYTVLVDENGDAYIEELEGYPRNESGLYSILADASEVTATQLVEENPSDLEKYGLDNPLAEAAVTYSDGSVFRLKVGDSTPSGSEMYVQTENGNVYLMQEMDVWGLISPMSEYVERRLIPPLESSSDVVESCKTLGLTKITFGGSLRETPIEITFDQESGTFYMVSPVRRKLGDEVASILGGVFGVYASHTVNLEPTEQDISDAGLDDPETVITLEYDGQTLEIRLDGRDKDLLSAMRSDVDILYDLDESGISFMRLQYQDFLPEEYIIDTQEEISSLEIAFGSETYTLVPGEEPTVNGEAVDAGLFDSFFTMALSARSEGERSQEVSGDPDMTLTANLTDQNRSPEVLQFYYDGSRSYDVDCNGSVTTYIKSSYVSKLQQALESLLGGEEFSTDW